MRLRLLFQSLYHAQTYTSLTYLLLTYLLITYFLTYYLLTYLLTYYLLTYLLLTLITHHSSLISHSPNQPAKRPLVLELFVFQTILPRSAASE